MTRSSRLRHSLPVVAGLALAMVLAACSGSTSTGGGSGASAAGAGSAPVDTSAKVTLTWWTGQQSDAEKTLEGLAKEFTAAHPNVTLNVSSGAPNSPATPTRTSATRSAVGPPSWGTPARPST